jgi:apolipoprotein N-acyltransferase
MYLWPQELFCIMDFIRKAGIVQWILSGILLGAGFVLSMLWPLGIIGIAYFIYLAQRTHSVKKLLVGGFVSWSIKSLMVLVWFWSTYPIEMSADFGRNQLLVIGLYWFITAVWLGVGGIWTAFLIRKISQLSSSYSLWYLSLPLVWLVGEMSSSFFFSLMTFGEGGTLTPAFSFGFVGYLLAQHTLLLQLAQIAGVYSLGFFSVVLALFFLQMCQTIPQSKRYVLIAVLLVCVASGQISISTPEPVKADSYRIITVDTSVDSNYVYDEEMVRVWRSELDSAISTALSFTPDYLLLPEDSRYFSQTQPSDQVKKTFQFLHQQTETIIVDSGRTEVGDQTVLQSFILNNKTDVVDQSHKRYLVPQGEFMPVLYVQVLKLLGYGAITDKIAGDISYEVGPLTSQADFSPSSPGVLFCFESVSPWGVRTIVKERPDVPFIAHPMSHDWFHKPKIFRAQLATMLQVQAVWNHQYIVSVGNQVPGQVFTPNGEILSPTKLAEANRWVVREVFIPRDY